MKRNTLLIALAAVLLVAGSVWAGASKEPAKAAPLMRMSGTIASANGSELVLSSKVGRKVEEEKFVINAQTKTKGELTAGNRAIVHYKNENGQKMATTITASKAVAAKSK